MIYLPNRENVKKRRFFRNKSNIEMEYIMTKETLMRYKRIYNILFSFVLIIAGIFLIAGVLCIYFSGDQPFSRESVANTFSSIAFPIYLCLGMTVMNIVLEFILPTEYKKMGKKIGVQTSSHEKEESSTDKRHRLYRHAILIIAILFIVGGLLNEGTIAVLAKAINICTECIGLG